MTLSRQEIDHSKSSSSSSSSTLTTPSKEIDLPGVSGGQGRWTRSVTNLTRCVSPWQFWPKWKMDRPAPSKGWGAHAHRDSSRPGTFKRPGAGVAMRAPACFVPWSVPLPSNVVSTSVAGSGASGVIGSLVVYGVLQEKMSCEYGGERLSSSVFLFVMDRIGALVFAVITAVLHGESLMYVALLWRYVAVSVFNVSASACQYEMLKYLSFPVQILGESFKMMSVMVWGMGRSLWTALQDMVVAAGQVSEHACFCFSLHRFRLRLRPGGLRAMCMSTASCGVHSSGCFDASGWSRCTWACICLKRQHVESRLCVFWRPHWGWGDRLSTPQAPRLPLRQRRVHRRRRDCTTGPPPHIVGVSVTDVPLQRV